MKTIPMIRVEVEGLRQQMVIAFHEHTLKLDEMFQEAIKDATEPYKIQQILTETANIYLRKSIEESVKDYFSYGEGAEVVKKCVQDTIGKQIKLKKP